MKQPYNDIRRLTDKEPLWYDEKGVPRYSEFRPDDANAVYAEEVALVLLACQSCNKRMKCAVSSERFVFINGKVEEEEPVSTVIRSGTSGYGDPPCWTVDGAQCAGSTMTPIELRVLEFWRRDNHGGWVRVPELEIPLEDG